MFDLIKYLLVAYLLLPFTIAEAKSNVIVIDDNVQLVKVSDSVFVHKSYSTTVDGIRFSSNGLLVINMGNAILIDTPRDSKSTSSLLRFIEESLNVSVQNFIAMHFHDDCIGGLPLVKTKGIPSYAHKKTMEECIKHNYATPKESFSDDTTFYLNGLPVQCAYYGEGHTRDNCVCYIPSANILFGGCLVRALSTRGLGNISDANIEQWNKTIINISEAFPKANIVVPGHGDYGNRDLLTHTLKLVDQAINKL